MKNRGEPTVFYALLGVTSDQRSAQGGYVHSRHKSSDPFGNLNGSILLRYQAVAAQHQSGCPVYCIPSQKTLALFRFQKSVIFKKILTIKKIGYKDVNNVDNRHRQTIKRAEGPFVEGVHKQNSPTLNTATTIRVVVGQTQALILTWVPP